MMLLKILHTSMYVCGGYDATQDVCGGYDATQDACGGYTSNPARERASQNVLSVV